MFLDNEIPDLKNTLPDTNLFVYLCRKIIDTTGLSKQAGNCQQISILTIIYVTLNHMKKCVRRSFEHRCQKTSSFFKKNKKQKDSIYFTILKCKLKHVFKGDSRKVCELQVRVGFATRGESRGWPALLGTRSDFRKISITISIWVWPNFR